MTETPTIRIAFLDVGQGDSIIVSTPTTHEAIIIDCPKVAPVFAYLRDNNIHTVRGLFITHLHLDHYHEVIDFLDNCLTKAGVSCEQLRFNWPNQSRLAFAGDADNHSTHAIDTTNLRSYQRTIYQDLHTWTDTHRNQCTGLVRDTNHPLVTGALANHVHLLQPYHGQIGRLTELGLNNTSVIIRVTNGMTSALLTADIEPKGWAILQEHTPDMQHDVLKFPHHGAWKDADPADILDAIQPSVVVISVGTDGAKYQHPNPHVFAAIADRPQIQLYCTQGTIQCNAQVMTDQPAILDTHAQMAPLAPIRIPRGCPCAGTVIVELRDQVTIEHPPSAVHQHMIQTHYPQHQCVMCTTGTSIEVGQTTTE